MRPVAACVLIDASWVASEPGVADHEGHAVAAAHAWDRALDRMTEGADADVVARTVAVGRIGVGALLLAAPRLAWGLMSRGGRAGVPDSTVAALRMVGGRDLVLGLGVLAADDRGSEAVAAWTEAGAAADATDAVVLLRAGSLRPSARLVGLLVASVAALLGVSAARRLR